MAGKWKRNAAAAGWHLLKSEHLFENAHFKLRRDRVRIGAAHEIDFTYFQIMNALRLALLDAPAVNYVNALA